MLPAEFLAVMAPVKQYTVTHLSSSCLYLNASIYKLLFYCEKSALQHDNHCSNCIKNNGIAAYVQHRMERFSLFHIPKARLGEY